MDTIEELNFKIAKLEAEVALHEAAYAQIDSALNSIREGKDHPDEMWCTVRWLPEITEGIRERLAGLTDARDLAIYRSQQAEAVTA